MLVDQNVLLAQQYSTTNQIPSGVRMNANNTSHVRAGTQIDMSLQMKGVPYMARKEGSHDRF